MMEPFEPAGGKDSPPAPQQPCPLTWLCLFGSLHTNGVLSISRPLLGDGESSLCAFSNVFLMAPELLDIDDDGDAPGCLSLDLLPSGGVIGASGYSCPSATPRRTLYLVWR